ncbi:hypothetical protein KDL44_06780 [bacterium]|nr:hypothetical protein [bacterium]
MHLRLSGLLLCVLLLAASSCGGGQSGARLESVSAGNQSLQQLLPGIPQDPLDGEELRDASALVNDSIQGREAVSHNGSIVNQSLLLKPDVDASIRYAVYRIPGIGPQTPFSGLSVEMSGIESDGLYYFALADFSLQRWQFKAIGASADSETFDLLDIVDPLSQSSPQGNLYVSVVVVGKVAAFGSVDRVHVEYTAALHAPEVLTASNGLYAGFIRLEWSQVPGAQSYEIEYRPAGADESAFSFLAELSTELEPIFQHASDSPVGDEAEYDFAYDYRVRALTAEEQSDWSAVATGLRRTGRPELAVSRRQIHIGVVIDVITQEIRPGSTVTIYRNDTELHTDQPLSGGDNRFFDFFTDDYSAYSYTAIITSDLGPSLESEPALGCSGQWISREVATNDPGYGGFGDIDPDLDPALAGPAICYWDDDRNTIRYGVLDPGGDLFVDVIKADLPEIHMALAHHAERPWIAWPAKAAEGLTQGLYISRGTGPNPAAAGAFMSYQLQEGEVAADSIRMNNASGRLEIMWSSRLLSGSLEVLNYAYALKDDPLDADDWRITRVLEDVPSFRRVPREFDFGHLEGRVAGLWVVDNDDEVQMFRALVDNPQLPADWEVVTVTAYGPSYEYPSGLCLEQEGELLHCAYTIPPGSGNGGLLAYLPLSIGDGELQHEPLKILSMGNDVNYEGICMSLLDSGQPAVFSSIDGNHAPLITSPLLHGGLILPGPDWLADYFTVDIGDSPYRDPADISEPRSCRIGDRLYVMHELEDGPAPPLHRIYVSELQPKS